MRRAAAAVLLGLGSCIAPSVVSLENRAVVLDAERTSWSPAQVERLAGTFVSTELTGPLALSLRMVAYAFESEGTYTGAALLDTAPPRFEVLAGTWTWDERGLSLDGGPPAQVEVAADGSLRLSGDEGAVILRRQRRR